MCDYPFGPHCEWSPFEVRHVYADVTNTQLTRAVMVVANRMETLGSLLGIAATSHDFNLQEHELEDVGVMIKEMAKMSFSIAGELETRIKRMETEGEAGHHG